jgi:16S rRNA (cytosine967-C5)-methyltransferase
VAADVAASRVAVLRQNLARLGRRVPVVQADAIRPPFAPGSFDRVVLDLPCTGTGTLGKHPELKWRLSADEIGRLERQALSMLRSALPLVAPGGLLVAVTCSLEAEENERVMERLLADGAPFARLDLTHRVDPALARSVRAPGLVRIFPTPSHDGFTVQVLERVSNTSVDRHL